ncbi:MAG: NAD(P)/FAD-dependent oxidoreductase [Myxococcota bacterium]|nr:NAD(P)/FAD-dependent oxidoreductase [Myxococcota bacterium]
MEQHRPDFDVVIIGGGLSGIGAACRLQRHCPHLTYTILEARPNFGGTWRFFKYPGLRSDSDMHSYAFPFMPWVGTASVVDGDTILDYLEATIRTFNLAERFQFGMRVSRANWHGAHQRWALNVESVSDGHQRQVHCRFLLVCAGYYDYDEAFKPAFEGQETYSGTIIHPQFWPEDLDPDGKQIVVVGSGATAVTMIPALAERGARVTMVQRSPSHIVAWPREDPLARLFHRMLPDPLAFRLIRAKNIVQQQLVYTLATRFPDWTTRLIRRNNRAVLGNALPVDPHFTPAYPPWEQRLCVAPDGDLFSAIRRGDVTVETGQIERLNETGVILEGDQHLPADMVVTATGLKLSVLGKLQVMVDGQRVDFGQTMTYRGLAYSDVPNLISVFGYVNASWTLRADLVCRYTCRLLNHLDANKWRQFVPRPSEAIRANQRPMIDNFTPGYLRRSMHLFPKQGPTAPWTNPQNFMIDYLRCLHAPIADGHLEFG